MRMIVRRNALDLLQGLRVDEADSVLLTVCGDDVLAILADAHPTRLLACRNSLDELEIRV